MNFAIKDYGCLTTPVILNSSISKSSEYYLNQVTFKSNSNSFNLFFGMLSSQFTNYLLVYLNHYNLCFSYTCEHNLRMARFESLYFKQNVRNLQQSLTLNFHLNFFSYISYFSTELHVQIDISYCLMDFKVSYLPLPDSSPFYRFKNGKVSYL